MFFYSLSGKFSTVYVFIMDVIRNEIIDYLFWVFLNFLSWIESNRTGAQPLLIDMTKHVHTH